MSAQHSSLSCSLRWMKGCVYREVSWMPSWPSPQGFKNTFTAVLHHALASCIVHSSLTLAWPPCPEPAKTLSRSNSSVTARRRFQLPHHITSVAIAVWAGQGCCVMSSHESLSSEYYFSAVTGDIPGLRATYIVRFPCWQNWARGTIYRWSGARFICPNPILVLCGDWLPECVCVGMIHSQVYRLGQRSGSSQLVCIRSRQD